MNLSQHRPITEEELVVLIQDMGLAEESGLLNDLFCNEQPPIDMLDHRELLIQSINPTMKLTKGFFLKTYGHEISHPGFKDKAIEVLEKAGCSQAMVYYEQIVGEYQRSQDEIKKMVAADYVQEFRRKWDITQKEGVGQRNIQKLDSRQLLKLLKNLIDRE